MKPNLSDLQKRVLTAVLGAAALLGLVLEGGRIGVAFIAVIISLGMVYEFVEMTFTLPDRREKRNLLLGLTWLIGFLNFWIPRAEHFLFLSMFIVMFAYFLFTAERYRPSPELAAADPAAGTPELNTHFKELMYAVFGVFYLAFVPLFLVLLREFPHGMHWVIVFLIVIWLGDTGGFFIGRRFGKRKLYAAISPKKTMEGAAGGIGFALAGTIIYKLATFHQMPWAAAIVIPILVTPFAIMGDLCESFLKRAFGKKDSGTILPGHGGFLDRFDAVVFGLPIMYGCLKIFA